MSLTASVPVSKEAEQNWPVWFQDQQASAWSDYEATPEPKRKDEAWRFSNIAALGLSEFEIARPVTSEGRLINNSQGLTEFSASWSLATMPCSIKTSSDFRRECWSSRSKRPPARMRNYFAGFSWCSRWSLARTNALLCTRPA